MWSRKPDMWSRKIITTDPQYLLDRHRLIARSKARAREGGSAMDHSDAIAIVTVVAG